jgi:translation elongation factor EF-Tu-like GTPase
LKCSNKILDRGEAGDNVGLLLRGIDKADQKEVWLSLR